MRWFLTADGKPPLIVEDLYTALVTILVARAAGALNVRLCCEVLT